MEVNMKFKKNILNITLSFLFITISNYSQDLQTKNEEYKQSLLEKYSSYLTEENEIMSLRSSTSQHYKLNEKLFIALLYSTPSQFSINNNAPIKIEVDTTLIAPASGRVFKDGVNLTKYDNTLRIQNTDDYGCENGYRSWVKYNISSMPNSANVVEIQQNIYCIELVEGIFDYLEYNIIRVDNDPVTATPGALWTDIYEGAMYEYDEWVTNPPGWEWCILNSPAPMDFTNALNNQDWFALGYMVKCNEDDADYRAVFNGYLDTNPPYLIVSYNIVVGIDDIQSNPKSFDLYQNYPNPFNPTTVIRYQLPKISYVEIKVFDILGREVVTLINEEQTSGTHEVEFNAAGLPSGFYIYKLQSGEFTSTKKMILLK
jgi:hypothetical protein